jgi:hypothetical protein
MSFYVFKIGCKDRHKIRKRGVFIFEGQEEAEIWACPDFVGIGNGADSKRS